MLSPEDVLASDPAVRYPESITRKRSSAFRLDRWEAIDGGYTPLGRSGFADDGFVRLAEAGKYTQVVVRYDPIKVSGIGERLIARCDKTGEEGMVFELLDFESEVRRGSLTAKSGPDVDIRVSMHVHAYWMGWTLFAQLHGHPAAGFARFAVTRGLRNYPLLLAGTLVATP